MRANTRRRYVRLVPESVHPVDQVARDLGSPDNVLHCWSSAPRLGNSWGEAGVGAGHPGRGFFTTCGGVLREGVPMRCCAIQE